MLALFFCVSIFIPVLFLFWFHVFFYFHFFYLFSAQSRNSAGGTSKERVLEQIVLVRERYSLVFRLAFFFYDLFFSVFVFILIPPYVFHFLSRYHCCLFIVSHISICYVISLITVKLYHACAFPSLLSRICNMHEHNMTH